MISAIHLRGCADLEQRAATALTALAARPGYLRGTLGRSTDDPADWLLITEWENVGSYRRALGNYDVKLRATALFADAAELSTSFEALLDVAPGGAGVRHVSDLDTTR